MPELKFRNLNVTPDDPIEQWGVEGLLTANDCGSPVEADPHGPVAMDRAQALELAEDVGVRLPTPRSRSSD